MPKITIEVSIDGTFQNAGVYCRFPHTANFGIPANYEIQEDTFLETKTSVTRRKPSGKPRADFLRDLLFSSTDFVTIFIPIPNFKKGTTQKFELPLGTPITIIGIFETGPAAGELTKFEVFVKKWAGSPEKATIIASTQLGPFPRPLSAWSRVVREKTITI